MAFKKGYTPYNKGLKGYYTSGCFKKGHKINLGRHHTEKTINEMSKIRLVNSKLPSVDAIKQLYLDQKESSVDIAKLYQVTPCAVRKSLKKHNVHLRNKSEANSLDSNPAWRGGKSFEPYTLDFNKRFKESIRERDNRCCVLCNKLEEDNKGKLIIHHIDYDKKSSLPQNCVSLCRRCHGMTNFERSGWQQLFQYKLKERYGYEYTEDHKIILDFTKVCEVNKK